MSKKFIILLLGALVDVFATRGEVCALSGLWCFCLVCHRILSLSSSAELRR